MTMHHDVFHAVLFTALTGVLAQPAIGQTCNPAEVAKLLASDGSPDDLFGYVAISGDLAISGAFLGDSDNGINAGSAYVFRFNGVKWVQEDKLLASDGASGDGFGIWVSISGDAAVVGAPFNSDSGPNTGSAYVYRFNGAHWVEEQKLLAADGASEDLFGFPVTISGDVVIAGAVGDADNGFNSGSAYVFRFDGATWVQEQKLLAADGAPNDGFGLTASVSGDVALVGASSDGDNGPGSGSAYVFRHNGVSWVQEEKLLPHDGAAGDQFGWAGVISGDVAILGAKYDDDNGADSGSAYVFRDNGVNWNEDGKLLPADGAAGDGFGHAVSIFGNVATVGAPDDADNGSQSGSAYLFRYDGANWVQQPKILPSDGAPVDVFGISISVWGDSAAVGATWDDDNGHDSGSVYVLDLNCAAPCPQDLDASGAVDVLDLLALLAAWGSDPGGPPDFNGDLIVDVLDLLELLSAWGPCP